MGPGATERLQANEPGTIRQNLRDLKVADATVQMENLAREVGIDLATGTERTLAQCDGHIVAAFRDLKAVHERLRADLLDAAGRLQNLATVLKNAPADFQYPSAALPLEKLLARPAHIEGALEDARGEEVDRLRSDFDGPARLGNFQPLMSRARDLLDEPRKSLTLLLGNVLSVENTIAEYRQTLAASEDLQRSHRGSDALARASGGIAPRPLSTRDIEGAGALSEGLKLVNERVHDNAVSATATLAGTGVSFERWCAIVARLDAGRDPGLETQEADALVDRGLVQRTYRLGGSS